MPTPNPPQRITNHAPSLRIAARAQGAIGNPLTGFGTARDPGSYAKAQPVQELNDYELAALYQDGMIQKCVDPYPIEGAEVWMKYTFQRSTSYGTYGVGGDAVEDYLDSKVHIDLGNTLDPDRILSTASLKDLFREQSLSSRIFRNGWLLIGADDGQELSEPINPNGIKSIRWIEPLNHWEIQPVYHKQSSYSNPIHYQMRRWGNDKSNDEVPKNALIHKTRIIKFAGKPRPEAAHLYSACPGMDYSIIDGVFKAIARGSQSLDSLSYMIQTASVFDYGLEGLSDYNPNESEEERAAREAAQAARMQSIMFALSTLRIFLRDASKETMTTVNRNFGGTSEAIDRIMDAIAFYSDVPRYKIFGQSTGGGLGSSAQEGMEERDWDGRLTAWRSQNWATPYLYLGKLALLAKDGVSRGRLLPGLGVSIPSCLKKSTEEKLSQLDQFATAAQKFIAMGVLDPMEVRQAFAGNEADFNITLLQEVSDRMAAMPVDLGQEETAGGGNVG